ncbi:MAG: alanine racemase, partial [Polyangiaceae bacterium]
MMLARLEIDLGAIRANAEAIARFVAPARFAAVVKANGYGHGIIEVARAVDQQVARICVYELNEAVQLREAGIRSPILIMGPIESGDL